VLEAVRRWVNRLPATSRDLPILYAEGRYWTPNEILRQIESNPNHPTSITLQNLLEAHHQGYGQYGEADLWQLAKQRLLKALQTYPVIFRTYSLIRPTITGAELKQEIQLETPLGISFIQNEIKQIQRELALYG
jgi:hypothetical protein